jgi:hypothetical protein
MSRARLVGAAAVMALLSHGCAGSFAQSDRPPLSVGPAAEWATAVLGATPTRFEALRASAEAGMQDAWGTTHGIIEPIQAAMIACRQIDVYDDEDLIVMHDVPPSMDPARPSVGGQQLVFLSQSPSGVRSYGRVNMDGSPYGGDAMAVNLIVLPPSTWFVGNRFVLTRLAIMLGQNARPVPWLPAHASSIADSFLAKAAPPYWWPFQDRSTGGGLVMWGVPPGGPAPVAIKVAYVDAAAARAAAEDLRRLWQGGALRTAQHHESREMDDFLQHIVRIDTEGNAVLVLSHVGLDSAAEFARNL